MKATCPNDPTHKRFVTTVHVTQKWEVDETGEFRKVLADCLSQLLDIVWTCAVCGAEVKVKNVN